MALRNTVFVRSRCQHGDNPTRWYIRHSVRENTHMLQSNRVVQLQNHLRSFKKEKTRKTERAWDSHRLYNGAYSMLIRSPVQHAARVKHFVKINVFLKNKSKYRRNIIRCDVSRHTIAGSLHLLVWQTFHFYLNHVSVESKTSSFWETKSRKRERQLNYNE